MSTATTERAPSSAQIEAATAAFETAVVAASMGAVARQLSAILAPIRSAFNDTSWRLAIRRAAQDLTHLHPGVSTRLRQAVQPGVKLGAKHAGVPLPAEWSPLHDDVLSGVIGTIDLDVRRVARDVAERLPQLAPGSLTAAETMVGRVESKVRVAAVTTAHRSVAAGFEAASTAAGKGRMWIAERNACLACLAYSGLIAPADENFPAALSFGARAAVWTISGPSGPPAHHSCRCHLQVPDRGVSVGLRREASRSVVKGWSGYDSLPARLKAAQRLIARGVILPPTVIQRAENEIKRGQFGPLPPLK